MCASDYWRRGVGTVLHSTVWGGGCWYGGWKEVGRRWGIGRIGTGCGETSAARGNQCSAECVKHGSSACLLAKVSWPHVRKLVIREGNVEGRNEKIQSFS